MQADIPTPPMYQIEETAIAKSPEADHVVVLLKMRPLSETGTLLPQLQEIGFLFSDRAEASRYYQQLLLDI